ncbi:MAG: ABC transporter ATP-binding protein [Trueperaceae bacterium]|nr:ABC transporter ATP-binding protein [Trueperaceae bacterium]
MSEVVLSVQDVSIVYRVSRGQVKASQHISFDLHKGESLALIGESGSGKTTVSLSFIDMLPSAAKITGGKVLYTRDGKTENIFEFSEARMRDFRWHDCAMVFQGAQNAFNPVLKIKEQFLDTARAHGWRDKGKVIKRTLELLRLVRLDPERTLESFPHELSGGMKQRTLLALGVLLDPQVVILDEPTTALDILTQRAIIEVLKEMQSRLGFSIIFISHDLALAAEMADRVATMYAGEMVELGSTQHIFYEPLHPYSLGLLQSVPRLSQDKDELSSIKGNPPDLIDPPSGCKFHPRCPFAQELCNQEEPVFKEHEPGHFAACHFTENVIEARANLWKKD